MNSGVSGAIYANQVIRAIVQAVKDLLDSLDVTGSTADKETQIASISELFELVGTEDLLDSTPWSGLDALTSK